MSAASGECKKSQTFLVKGSRYKKQLHAIFTVVMLSQQAVFFSLLDLASKPANKVNSEPIFFPEREVLPQVARPPEPDVQAVGHPEPSLEVASERDRDVVRRPARAERGE